MAVALWPLDLLLWDFDGDSYGCPFAEDFGFVVHPQDIREDKTTKYRRRPGRYWRNQRRRRRQQNKRSGSAAKDKLQQNLLDGGAPTIGKEGFQVCINVEQFQPNELTVKTVNNCVIIEGKHEERLDEEGLVSRHFIRRYPLPEGYNADEVTSTLSSDGILTIKAPPPPSLEQKEERVVEIQQTGPAHLSVKENPQEENGNEEKQGKESEEKMNTNGDVGN